MTIDDLDAPLAGGSLLFDPDEPSQPAPYLEGLNAGQCEAVKTTEGPLLVLAGAGTGKTRVLTTRLTHILAQGKAFPGQVLAVTFTNKAAQEMRERVGALSRDRAVGSWWMGTFHALCARMLRRGNIAQHVGLESDFSIIDSDDQMRVVKQLLKDNGFDDKKWPPKAVLGAIQRWKDKAHRPETVPESEAREMGRRRILEFYRLYQERLLGLGACDFGDLILHCLTIFQKHPAVLAEYHNRFRYVMVDEYQDTNVAQYLWLRLLAQGSKNICCVGDDDQSIYGWRGAEVGNILKFEQDFSGAKVVRLERNYRSTGRILAAASHIIKNNESRLGKTLWTNDGLGEKLRVRGLWDGEAEARFVGEEIEKLQRKGVALADIAILVRAGAQTREFEERFLTLGLPYRVVGVLRFYERLEIRDAIAFMRLVYSSDDSLAFERVLNKPRRGLGPAAQTAIHTTARTSGKSLFAAALELVEEGGLRPAARKALQSFVNQVLGWQEKVQTMPHSELVGLILEESGYLESWQKDKSVEAKGRVENLRELVNAVGDYDSLEAFLDHVSLVMEKAQTADLDMISIMTLHGAKGLEFANVFLPGWEEGLFPSQRSMDEKGLQGLEEERRLAYVGLTRARQRVILSFAANRRMHGSWSSTIASRFIDELPVEHIEQENDRGLYSRSIYKETSDSRFGDGYHLGDEARSPGLSDSRIKRAYQGAYQERKQNDGGPAQRSSGGDDDFERGDRVFHRKFGCGTVRQVEGDRLTIAFDKAGSKKVLDSFVVSQDQED